MRACGVISQSLFAHDVERFVIETILRTGSFDRWIIVPYRGSLRTFGSYFEFFRWKHRVLKTAVVRRMALENHHWPVAYGISIVGMTSVRVVMLLFQDGMARQPIIRRRTVAGLCVPWFQNVDDN